LHFIEKKGLVDRSVSPVPIVNVKASLIMTTVVSTIMIKMVARTPERYIQNSGWWKNFPSVIDPNLLF